MALRQIVLEENDEAILRKKSRPVKAFDERLQSLIDDMLQTMYKHDGIGLAAVQVGILRRLFVIDLQDGSGPRVFINPKISQQSGKQVHTEGCLSLPGLWGEVERPEQILIEAVDRDNQPIRMEAEGMLAVCACHEYDHLEGILFRDKAIGKLVRA